MSKKYSVSGPSPPLRSASVISASNWSLSETPHRPKSVIGRFRKRPREKSLQTKRFSQGPCLCGDVDAVDTNGRSLLFYSARYGQLDTAVQLIEAGCSPNQKDILGNTPLHEAVEKSHLDVAEAFLKDGTLVIEVNVILNRSIFFLIDLFIISINFKFPGISALLSLPPTILNLCQVKQRHLVARLVIDFVIDISTALFLAIN